MTNTVNAKAICAVLFGLTLSLMAGCAKNDSRAVKTGKEQTESPAEPRYPAGASRTAPGPRISLSPPDMTSQVANTPLHVLVDNKGAAVGDERLSALAGRLKVVTWPSRVGVDIEIVTKDAVPRYENGYQVFAPAMLELRPKAAIDPTQWYAIIVDGLPDGFVASDGALLHSSGQEIIARFTRASDPRLARVRRCKDPSSSEGKIVLDFSEHVTLASIQDLQVRAPEPCAINTIDNIKTAESIGFVCKTMDSGGPVEISVGALASAAGTAMHSGFAKSLGPSSFKPWGACEIAPLDE
jgi:hypothetical protein